MKELSHEIVFRGHPDKLADQISDKILMEYLKKDSKSIVNIDVVGGADTVFVTGSINSSVDLDVPRIVKSVLADVGCSTDVTVIDDIKSSNMLEICDETLIEIYGYACDETSSLLPKGMVILQEIAKAYDNVRKVDKRFLSDGKVNMIGLYDDNDRLIKINSIIVNHQNTGQDTEVIHDKMYELIFNIAKKHEVIIESCELNPYGPYILGGFDRDTGLVGQKINIDYYQGFAPVNLSALSGKDPNCLIRSATYKAREIAKTILKEHKLKYCEVQLVYNKEKSKPTLIKINSDKGVIKTELYLYEECLPANIVKDLDLVNRDYVMLSSFGHFQN